MAKEKNSQSDAEQQDLNLTAIIQALDNNEPLTDLVDSPTNDSASKGASAKGNAPTKSSSKGKSKASASKRAGSKASGDQSKASKSSASPQADSKAEDAAPDSAFDPKDVVPNAAFDPNATMDYKQAGVSYPELNFADENNAGHTSANTDEEQPKKRKSSGSKFNKIEKTSSASSEDLQEHAPAADPWESPSRATSKKRSRSNRGTQGEQSSLDHIEYDELASNYQPINLKNSTYKIRGGGGGRLGSRSPVFIVASIIVVIAGLGLMVYGVNQLLATFNGEAATEEFALSTTQTREAIDARLPILVYYIDTSIDDTLVSLTESGQFVYANDRYQPDSPDAGAAGSELMSMPQEMNDEQMDGYYSGSYNAYSPEELIEYFNGAYTLDMARGDLGSWNKLKYVNLNATSIEDEMAHLAALQGLSDDTVTVSAEGVDSRGNLVIQGQKALDGERVLYFKIAACPFEDIYTAKSISDTSVYITCTLATYDFFTGSDEITPA